MSALKKVANLESAAANVARQLPETHVVTRPFWSAASFREATENFLQMLYAVNLETLDDEELLTVENCARIVESALELHLRLQYRKKAAEDCQRAGEVLARVRDAITAIESGLPADPKRRPTDEELLNSLAVDLEPIVGR